LKKWINLCAIVALVFSMIPTTTDAKTVGDDWGEMDCTKAMDYSEAVKNQFDDIYHQIYMNYVKLIELYYWQGALTQQQRDTRYQMLKNYIQTFAKRNYQWCSEHESDEWEEEWYNIDD